MNLDTFLNEIKKILFDTTYEILHDDLTKIHLKNQELSNTISDGFYYDGVKYQWNTTTHYIDVLHEKYYSLMDKYIENEKQLEIDKKNFIKNIKKIDLFIKGSSIQICSVDAIQVYSVIQNKLQQTFILKDEINNFREYLFSLLFNKILDKPIFDDYWFKTCSEKLDFNSDILNFIKENNKNEIDTINNIINKYNLINFRYL